MSAAPMREHVQAVDERLAPRAVAFLERPAPGQQPADAVLRHQQLLDALDRRDYQRMLIWPEGDPAAVAHASPTGSLVVAGSPEAGPHFATYLSASAWRVLIGDASLAQSLLESAPKGLRRRRMHVREQRFMATRAPASIAAPERLRLATAADLDALTEMACRLHVEDRMGPPLTRIARSGVADRMRSSIARSATWVVEQGDAVVAKFDVSLRTRWRGAQIAGVYVDESWRGKGIATAGVAAVARELMAEGLPGVTLHVRADNPAGRRAYERAGFVDRGAWTLALR